MNLIQKRLAEMIDATRDELAEARENVRVATTTVSLLEDKLADLYELERQAKSTPKPKAKRSN